MRKSNDPARCITTSRLAVSRLSPMAVAGNPAPATAAATAAETATLLQFTLHFLQSDNGTTRVEEMGTRPGGAAHAMVLTAQQYAVEQQQEEEGHQRQQAPQRQPPRPGQEGRQRNKHGGHRRVGKHAVRAAVELQVGVVAVVGAPVGRLHLLVVRLGVCARGVVGGQGFKAVGVALGGRSVGGRRTSWGLRMGERGCVCVQGFMLSGLL